MEIPASDDRRDFIYYMTAATGTIAAGAAIWPLLDQMNSSADVSALLSIKVDVSGVALGAQLTVKWRGKPVFVRHRTAAEIEAAATEDPDDLPDRYARNRNLPDDAPATDANRAVSGKPAWLVQVGVCTHLGCVPVGNGSGDWGGWFCPCHGSHYDKAGRIRKGPAPENLEIPKLTLDDALVLTLG